MTKQHKTTEDNQKSVKNIARKKGASQPNMKNLLPIQKKGLKKAKHQIRYGHLLQKKKVVYDDLVAEKTKEDDPLEKRKKAIDIFKRLMTNEEEKMMREAAEYCRMKRTCRLFSHLRLPAHLVPERILKAIEMGQYDMVNSFLSRPKLSQSNWNDFIHAAMKIENESLVLLILSHPNNDISPSSLQQVLEWASENGSFEIFKILLDFFKVDPSHHNDKTVYMSVAQGHQKIVEILLQDARVDITVNRNECIRIAGENGHVDILKLLLKDPRADVTACRNECFRMACINGNLSCVELLLSNPNVDPCDLNNFSIRFASEYGQINVVKMLLTDRRIDPSADNNYALRIAAECGHLHIVQMLLEDIRVDPSAANNYCYRWAVKNRKSNVIQLLHKNNSIK